MHTLLLFPLMFLPAGPSENAIDLPDDAEAIVLSLDYRGGGRLRRKQVGPLLSVHANGRARVTELFQDSVSELLLSPDELQSLLQFVLRQQQFPDLDAEALRQDIEWRKRQAGLGKLLDDSTTVIRVKTKKLDHEVAVYALRHYADRFPDGKEIAKLRSIEARLLQLVDIVRVGGEPALQRILELVNRELNVMHPRLAPFAQTELQNVQLRIDGGLQITFRKTTEDEDVVVAVVKQSKYGTTTVEIFASS